MSAGVQALFIHVRGVVQGVGFRPFVYGLATRLGLAGWVRNTSSGVEILVEGPPEALQRFREDLPREAPPLARIEGITLEPRSPDGLRQFEIRHSQAESGTYQLVSPDIAICEDCLRELFDSADRRYRYPFINCTNCGPRFTIIQDIPYDRPLTTMARFTMCPRCQAEYDDPRNRRFHAQPNACPECGPHVTLTAADGRVLAEREEAIAEARRAIMAGKIVAVKGLGGYQLACDATSEEAVSALRARKVRPHKPFAVMVPDLRTARRVGVVGPEEARLLQSPERPIVLLRAHGPGSSPADGAVIGLASGVSPGTGTVGVMLPYTPLHYLLLEPAPGFPPALVMTSGNLSEEPIAMENDEALARLGRIADLFLLHNRGIYARYDDSVWFAPDTGPQPVRRARGYAPFPVRLPFRGPQVLACGPELKNTFCLTRDEYAFLSPHIGDLENLETLEHYERSIELYERLFRIAPRIIACDLHPEYLATKYARARAAGSSDTALVEVQHHHAHIASCLADNGCTGPVIGVAFDGTGYGTDGHIWGGELLIADLTGFRRAGHLAGFPLPGGAAAIRRPFRTALAVVEGAGLDPSGFPALEALTAAEASIVRQQVARRLNTPLTTSAGRLFDAVSALLGVCGDTTYEAQAAMELEAVAATGDVLPYPLELREESGTWVLDWRPMLEALLPDIRTGETVPAMAARFHAGMAAGIVAAVRRIAHESGLRTVALSGGCFQNRLLLGWTAAGLAAAGLEVLTHRQVPANDGGVALGQAAIAAMTAT